MSLCHNQKALWNYYFYQGTKVWGFLRKKWQQFLEQNIQIFDFI